MSTRTRPSRWAATSARLGNAERHVVCGGHFSTIDPIDEILAGLVHGAAGG